MMACRIRTLILGEVLYHTVRIELVDKFSTHSFLCPSLAQNVVWALFRVGGGHLWSSSSRHFGAA